MLRNALEQPRRFVRYTTGLRSFLAQPVTEDECRARLADRPDREESLLELLRDQVFDHPASPYRALFAWAGITIGDVADLVRGRGLEGALHDLFDAGVFVTVDEFRGRRPIERPGFRLEVTEQAFDTPVPADGYVANSGGSRSGGRPVPLTFPALEEALLFEPFIDRDVHQGDPPFALWRPVPPGIAGLVNALRRAKQRRPTARWFSQSPVTIGRTSLRHDAVLRVSVLASRRTPTPIPWPEHVPVNRADLIAAWVAEQVGGGRPPVVSAPASGAVRVCLAARDGGLDITGTFFLVGGEPLTPAKVAVVSDAGARVRCSYAATEGGGRMAVGCADPTEVDDVHLLDRLAVIQRPDSLTLHPGAFLFTTVRPSRRSVLINVESDDHGTVERRECGCPLGGIGLSTHLSRIRSHEKVTTEGMSFPRTDIVELLETTLPARFGGDATDYQLVEDDRQGLHRLDIVVSPRVGDLDQVDVAGAFLALIGADSPSRRMMAGIWRDGQTVGVVRREPYVTASGKINAVHVLR